MEGFDEVVKVGDERAKERDETNEATKKIARGRGSHTKKGC